MKSSKLVAALTIIASALVMSSAQAGLIDEYTTGSSEYVQVYAHGTGVGATIEGAGVNRVVKLYVTNYTSGVGSSYWEGVVSNDEVVVNGIASITVNIPNTCDSTANTTVATYGSETCFAVNATFTKVDYLWKTNGVTQYTFGDLIYEYIGGISAYSATVTGTVTNSIGTVNADISTPRAYLGKYTNVTVKVSTAK